jgi:hypothetical protein
MFAAPAQPPASTSFVTDPIPGPINQGLPHHRPPVPRTASPHSRLLIAIVALAAVVVVGTVVAVATDCPFRTSTSPQPTTSPGAPGAGGQSSGPPSSDTTSAAAIGALNRLDAARILVPAISAPAPDAAGHQVTYAAAHLMDGDLTTAWRMNGAGATLEFDFDQPVTLYQIGLVNGYAKTDPYDGTDRYPQMRRIVRVTWDFDGRAEVVQNLLDHTETPPLMAVPGVRVQTVRLTIDATTTPGQSSLDYTPISELYLLGQ